MEVIGNDFNKNLVSPVLPINVSTDFTKPKLSVGVIVAPSARKSTRFDGTFSCFLQCMYTAVCDHTFCNFNPGDFLASKQRIRSRWT